MIIADPWGSWVKGAREGQQDARENRAAADISGMRNFQLAQGMQDNPYHLQNLQNETAMRTTQAQNYPEQLRLAMQGERFRNTMYPANMGIVDPLVQESIREYGGQMNPGGNFDYTYTNPMGDTITNRTNINDIMSPQSMGAQGRLAQVYGVNQYREQEILQRQLEEERRQQALGLRYGYDWRTGYPLQNSPVVPNNMPTQHGASGSYTVDPKYDIFGGAQ